MFKYLICFEGDVLYDSKEQSKKTYKTYDEAEKKARVDIQSYLDEEDIKNPYYIIYEV